MPAAVPRDQRADAVPEGVFSDVAPQHVEDHRGFLIADGVVLLVALLRELRDGIILLRPHIDGVAQQHHPALLARLCRRARQFLVIIIGQIGRQALDPVALADGVEDGVPDPRMDDLMPQRVGLDVAPLDDAAAQ